jgi:hypothetical protein
MLWAISTLGKRYHLVYHISLLTLHKGSAVFLSIKLRVGHGISSRQTTLYVKFPVSELRQFGDLHYISRSGSCSYDSQQPAFLHRGNRVADRKSRATILYQAFR